MVILDFRTFYCMSVISELATFATTELTPTALAITQ